MARYRLNRKGRYSQKAQFLPFELPSEKKQTPGRHGNSRNRGLKAIKGSTLDTKV